MRHKTVTEYDKAVLQYCRQCCGRKKIVVSDCGDLSCVWHDDMKAPRYIQVSLFPKEQFFEECERWMIKNLPESGFWYVDMRRKLEEYIQKEVRFGSVVPQWWSSVSGLCRKFGYVRTEERRVSQYTRSDEFYWRKKNEL